MNNFNFLPGRASWLPRNFTMNLIFAYILLIFSNTLADQVIKKSNQSISFMASVHADDNFPEVLGKSIDFMYERRLWKNLHMKGDVFISNSQIMRGPRDVFYTAVFGGNVDAYGNYWVGQTSRSFFEMESYILNRTLFQLGVNYRFGKRNQFIPEVGISMGSGYRASINVFEVAVERDTEIIRYARSRSNFLRRRLSGYYVGFSYAIHIKNSVFIQPTMRFYDINNRPDLSYGGAILNGASLGVTIRKDLFPVAKKRN